MIAPVTASEDARAQNGNRVLEWGRELWGRVAGNGSTPRGVVKVLLEKAAREGDSPVSDDAHDGPGARRSVSRVVWECCANSAGRRPPRLNTARRPIANKYCEGKLKKTANAE